MLSPGRLRRRRPVPAPRGAEKFQGLRCGGCPGPPAGEGHPPPGGPGRAGSVGRMGWGEEGQKPRFPLLPCACPGLRYLQCPELAASSGKACSRQRAPTPGWFPAEPPGWTFPGSGGTKHPQCCSRSRRGRWPQPRPRSDPSLAHSAADPSGRTPPAFTLVLCRCSGLCGAFCGPSRQLCLRRGCCNGTALRRRPG